MRRIGSHVEKKKKSQETNFPYLVHNHFDFDVSLAGAIEVKEGFKDSCGIRSSLPL